MHGHMNHSQQCGACETERTITVSPSTAAHIYGTFDVDKARAEAARERAPIDPFDGTLGSLKSSGMGPL